jgi:hypothetical protein
MRIEVLTVEGCPYAAAAIQLAATVGGETEVRVVEVSEAETDAARFLGSPTIRVDGHDIEPGADARRAYAHSCRLYSTERGRSPLPDEAWLRAALERGKDAASSTNA